MGTAGVRAIARLLLCLFIGSPLSAVACETDCLRQTPAADVGDRFAVASTRDDVHHHHHREVAASGAEAEPGRDSAATSRLALQPDSTDCAAALTVPPPSRLPDRQVPLSMAVVIGAAAETDPTLPVWRSLSAAASPLRLPDPPGHVVLRL